jgi:trehalose/maltose hydrolase-like predicted phosphorylase
VTAIIEKMGYTVPGDYVQKNFDYYIHRTSHGSTLSRLVHARLAFNAGLNEKGWQLYMESLESDLNDIQGGTTGEGIHCGVMAGTVYDSLVAFAGLDLSGDVPALDPELPAGWKGMEFCFGFRSNRFAVSISGTECKITLQESAKDKINIHICGTEKEMKPGATLKVALD